MSLTFKQLREANAARLAEFPPAGAPWSQSDLLAGLTAELGSLADAVVCLCAREPVRRPPWHAMGSILLWLDAIASHAGIDLEEAVREVFNADAELAGIEQRL